MFIHYDKNIINVNNICKIEYYLDAENFILLTLQNGDKEKVIGHAAIDIIMRVCPSYLEGKKFKYIKNSWVIHNMIGHPLMQIFSWFKLKDLAIKIHDLTIPVPKADSKGNNAKSSL